MTPRRWWAPVALVALIAAALIPSAVRAYDRYRVQQIQHAIHKLVQRADEGVRIPRGVLEEEDEAGGEHGDDAYLRGLADATLWGTPSPAVTARTLQLARAESQRWSSRMPRPVSPFAAFANPTSIQGGTSLQSGSSTELQSGAFSGVSWTNLGPSDATFEWNGSSYNKVDSGRINAIAVDPTDPQVVYLGSSGGGVWKTYNFGVSDPTWIPLTDNVGNLAVGALELDPQNPQTLYAGLGDAFDAPAGQVIRTDDGGATWTTPVPLVGTYPAASGGLAVKGQRVRALKVDPAHSNVVLVGTEVGLFRSTDGGAHFTLIDLPNAGPQLAESVWSIVSAGSPNGQTRFVVAGVYACDPATLPPDEGGKTYGLATGATGCEAGNLGDIWQSTDGGATWTSRRSAGAIPSAIAPGRVTLAASTPAGTSQAVTIYAQVGDQDSTAAADLGYWRSVDSGATWSNLGGTVANPTNGNDCKDIHVAAEQHWYNQAIAVDPTNSARVLVGGMLCGLRTSTGTSVATTWENVAHWLGPADISGNTSAGPLSYVHADWHAATLVQVGNTVRALVGTDGGLYWTDQLFASGSPTATTVAWNFANRGLVTHLAYSVASGDPADGDGAVALAGLQDNGTRIRESTTNPTTFNQVMGGDGFGTAYTSGGGNRVYWASVYGGGAHYQCIPGRDALGRNVTCGAGGDFSAYDPSLTCKVQGNLDANPFVTRYAVASASPTANTVLTISDFQVFRISGASGNWTAISPCLTAADGSLVVLRNVAASQTVDGLYGVAISGGRYAVTSNCGGSSTNCSWTMSRPLGVDANGNGLLDPSESLSFTSSLAFPTAPTGSAGDTYLAATSAPMMNDDVTPVPDSVGHLFKTTDRGLHWTPWHGSGAGALPNVPVHVVKFDPGDSSNDTVYVGTDLGVYRSTDGGANWERFGNGLPMVRVTDLFISRTGSLMRASTYGRGLWEIYPSATAERGVSGSGDYDRNLKIDFLDLAALSIRMGTSPATTAPPLYDWNADLTGTVNGIDDADLTALLAKFGSTP